MVVSADLKRALHDRLEAGSSDYRELRSHIGSGRIVLVIVAALHAAQALGAIFVDDAGPLRTATGAYFLVLAVFFGATAWLVERAPVAALLGTAAVWLALQLLLVLANPLSISLGLLPRIVVLALLARAGISAIRARKYLARLSQPERST